MLVPLAPQMGLRPTPLVELEALEGLPCGCVTVVYRTRPLNVLVVALEAKGPHCILEGHTPGPLLRLGDPYEMVPDDDSDDPATVSAH